MKQLLLIIAVVMSQSVLAADKKPIADPIVEKVIRVMMNKPEGELTEADLAKVGALYFDDTNIADAGLKEVAKCKKLNVLWLKNCTQITDAGVAELQKTLPKCVIRGRPKK